MSYLKYAAKAVYAAVIAGLTGAIAAAPDGYTGVEWLTIALGVVVAFGGTYGLTNGPAPIKADDAGQDSGD